MSWYAHRTLESIADQATTPTPPPVPLTLLPFSFCQVMNAVLDACLEAGQWQQGVDLFEELRRCGIPPDNVTYNVLLTGLSHQSPPQWRLALTYLDELRATNGPIRPDVFAYTAAMRACAEAGEVEECLTLLGEMERDKSLAPVGLTLTACVLACARSKRLKEVEGIMARFAALGVAPEESTYQALLLGCAIAGDTGRCEATLTQMRAAGFSVDERALSLAACAYGEAGKWEDCLRVLDEMEEKGMPKPPMAVGAAIAACVKALQWETAVSLLHELIAAGHKPSPQTCLHVLDGTD